LLNAKRLTELLRSLNASDRQEKTTLEWVFQVAEELRAKEAAKSLGASFEVRKFLEFLPSDAKRYFYSLLEALDIYYAIHHHPVSSSLVGLSQSENFYKEIRQIRDMCLLEVNTQVAY